MLGWVLIVTVINGWGWAESSHYEQFQTRPACRAAMIEVERSEEAIYRRLPEGGNALPQKPFARCQRGRTFAGGQRWSTVGVDWYPRFGGQGVAPDPFTR